MSITAVERPPLSISVEPIHQPGCDFCDHPKGEVFNFIIKDKGQGEKPVFRFRRCSSCLTTLVLKVLSFMAVSVHLLDVFF